MPTTNHGDGVIHIGKSSLHAARRALQRELGDQAAGCLQEIGYAAGGEMYARFEAWLPEFAGVNTPDELDAARLGEVLSAFFSELGWGRLEVEQLGSAGLSLTSDTWAEAELGAGAAYPSCFVTAGVLTEFLTRLAGGRAVSIMEIECRSQGDARCRFCAGSPQTLEAAFDALSSGQDFEAVFRT